MSFGELLFLAILALLVFGPRKLPEIARNMAKIMAELRRASNEFRYSLEDEIRNIEVTENTQKRLENPAPSVVEGTVPRQDYQPGENESDAFLEDLAAPADAPAAPRPGQVSDEAQAGSAAAPNLPPAAEMTPTSAISVPWDESNDGHDGHSGH